MLYHWLVAQEQATATRSEDIQVRLSAQILSHEKRDRNEGVEKESRNLPLITVDSPPTKVPSYMVDVEYGIAPFEHRVVIQGSLSGKQLDSSIQ